LVPRVRNNFKLGHCQNQIRPLRSETGQYPAPHRNRLAIPERGQGQPRRAGGWHSRSTPNSGIPARSGTYASCQSATSHGPTIYGFPAALLGGEQLGESHRRSQANCRDAKQQNSPLGTAPGSQFDPPITSTAFEISDIGLFMGWYQNWFCQRLSFYP
jgi:hypothetical protein